MSNLQEKAKHIVAEETGYEVEDLYVVWFCKTLKNWKALISTDVTEGEYYEVTHNGETHETYIDGYEKRFNAVVITD